MDRTFEEAIEEITEVLKKWLNISKKCLTRYEKLPWIKAIIVDINSL